MKEEKSRISTPSSPTPSMSLRSLLSVLYSVLVSVFTDSMFVETMLFTFKEAGEKAEGTAKAEDEERESGVKVGGEDEDEDEDVEEDSVPQSVKITFVIATAQPRLSDGFERA